MGRQENSPGKKAGVKIVAIALIAVVAVTAVAAFLSQSQPGFPESPSGTQTNGATHSQPTQDTSPQSPAAVDYWAQITNPAVESACLKEALEYAGSNAWAVLGCTCIESATAYSKNYSCTVGTIAGGKGLSVNCDKLSASCTIYSSETGTQTYSFEELAALIR